MPQDSIFDKIAHELNPAEFGHGFYDSAIAQPTKAIRQLVRADLPIRPQEFPTTPIPQHDTLAAKAGAIAGFVVDFTLLSKLTGGVMNKVLGDRAAGTVAGSAAKMFVAGGVYGGVFTPSNDGEDLLTSRLGNAAVTGASFAAMGAVSKGIENRGVFAPNSLKSKVLTNAIAGGAGGIVESYGSTALHEHRVATPAEALSTATQYAIFGAGFGAFDYGLAKGAQQVWKIPGVETSYWRTKGWLRDTHTDLRRSSYQFLSEHNMRHPLQRLGDMIYGTDLPPRPRPTLTPENNPVTALEKELPGFFKEAERREQLMETEPDRGKSYDMFEELKEYRTTFAQRLLELWHGTADKPGISQYTDAELATASGTTPERVAKIRTVLTSDMKSERYRDASPFMEGLADLAKFEVQGRNDHYNLLDGLETAKERFYGYDGSAVSMRLNMSDIHHYTDNHFATPPTWMPYEATDKLANVFHGSVSHSIPSVLAERQMLPAYELRLRGIGQSTGESANEEFPRRSISLTRDFGEAYAYHRHSPARLDTYPVVFGADARPMQRAQLAGSHERGELLINKLRLGSSWFGLRKPEISHIYVPDAEVSTIQDQLDARRIRGVNVVGFNQIPEPQWKPDPSIEELEKMLGYLY